MAYARFEVGLRFWWPTQAPGHTQFMNLKLAFHHQLAIQKLVNTLSQHTDSSSIRQLLFTQLMIDKENSLSPEAI